MSSELFLEPSITTEQAQLLERHILERTNRQVRDLRIDAPSDRIQVHGVVTRYYVKQLILATIRELFATVPVDLDIQVRS